MATQTQKQISVLSMSTLAFTVCFAVWVMFSIIGIPIKTNLGLNETQFGLLAATPILTGSLFRLPLGGVDLAVHTSTLDVYVDVKTAGDLTRKMRLKPTSVGNLTLRIITDLAPHLAAFVLDRDVMPPAVVGVDLLDDPDIRTGRAGTELVEKVLDGR